MKSPYCNDCVYKVFVGKPFEGGHWRCLERDVRLMVDYQAVRVAKCPECTRGIREEKS